MDYRGPDLDLRTSRWSAASTDPSGWREASNTRTALLSDAGQSRVGPSGVPEKSFSRMRRPISPPPARKSSGGAVEEAREGTCSMRRALSSVDSKYGKRGFPLDVGPLLQAFLFTGLFPRLLA